MYQIFINNEEVRAENSITIKEEFLNTSSIILNKVYPKSWSIDKLLTSIYFPKDYSKCKVLKNNELYFTGFVKNSGDTTLDFNKPKYATLQILDYKAFLSEGKTLDFVISNKTIEEAIEQVIESVEGYGFVKGNILINDNDIIGNYSTLDKSPFDVFQYFSEISNSLWTTRIIDEEHTAIDFYSSDNLPIKPDIVYSEEYFRENKIVNILPSFSTNDYRNRQIILSDSTLASINTIETKYSSGYSNTYTTDLPIGKINSITVNGTSATYATSAQKDAGLYADFYYTQKNASFESSEELVAGTKIVIDYIAYVNGREVVSSFNEIDRIKTQLNRSGEIERYENRNDITDSLELQKVAQSCINFYGKSEITLTVTTRNKDIFNVGDRTHFDIDFEELNDDYMVKSKQTNFIQSGTSIETIYTYELNNTFNTESALNYFDNQRRKSTGNITDGEFITRNIDISNNVKIVFNPPTIEEVVQ